MSLESFFKPKTREIYDFGTILAKTISKPIKKCK